MKKIVYILVAVVLMSMLCGCNKEKAKMEPDLNQIRSICELSTLECYYHNVAMGTKKAGEGITHWFEKDRDFWIEYTGIAKIGIDMTKVKMEMSGETVKVTLPKAELFELNIDKDSLNKKSYILSDDGINSNKITAEDQTKAINNAQEEMRKSVESNGTLLLNAQERAKMLIKNYIDTIGTLTETVYRVEWVEVSEE